MSKNLAPEGLTFDGAGCVGTIALLHDVMVRGMRIPVADFRLVAFRQKEADIPDEPGNEHQQKNRGDDVGCFNLHKAHSNCYFRRFGLTVEGPYDQQGHRLGCSNQRSSCPNSILSY